MADFDDVIVGGGIVGLSFALEAHRRGRSVALFERSPRAVGASIRNFGMVWPIGQPAGRALACSLVSRQIYLDLAQKAGFWLSACGSVHAVYHDDELACLHEFTERARPAGYDVQVVDPAEAVRLYPALNPVGLRGALLSTTELAVDPREVVASLTRLLASLPGVRISHGLAVRRVDHDADRPAVELASGEVVRARRVFVCSGDDIETLYPEILQSSPLIRCKLQMMRTPAQSSGWRLGSHFAAGSTLRHYPAFQNLPSLPAVRARFAKDLPHFDRWGIHVLASQNAAGEVTLGDSHEYAPVHDPFSREEIDAWILDYLTTFLRVPDLSIASRWAGVYLKRTDGLLEFIHAVHPTVHLVTGLGGNGMTLAPGLARELLSTLDRGEPWTPTPSAPAH